MKRFFPHGCIKKVRTRGKWELHGPHLSLGPLHLHQGGQRVYVCCSQIGGGGAVRRANEMVQGCPRVLPSSTIHHMPEGEEPKMGRLTSAPHCCQMEAPPSPKESPQIGPWHELSGADLKPNPQALDSSHLPEEAAGGPRCTCVTQFFSSGPVEAHCSDKDQLLMWAGSGEWAPQPVSE